MSSRRVNLWDLLGNWQVALLGPACVLAAFATAALAGREEWPVVVALLLGGIGMIIIFVYVLWRGAE